MSPQIVLFVSSAPNLHERYDPGVRAQGFRLLPISDAQRAEVLLTQFQVAALVFHLRAGDEHAWQACERVARAAGTTPVIVLTGPHLLDRLSDFQSLEHGWSAMLPDGCSADDLAMTLRRAIAEPHGQVATASREDS